MSYDVDMTEDLKDVGRWLEQASHHDRSGQEREAEPCYRMVYALGWQKLPPHEQCGFFVGFGSNLRITGKIEESIQILEEGFSHFPAHPEIKAFLALSYFVNRKERRAAELLFPALLEASVVGLAGFDRGLQNGIESFTKPFADKDPRQKIEIVAPDKTWPASFKSLKRQLEKDLFGLYINIEHIGSTSVPGLGSKNRLDVQISVSKLDEDFKRRLDGALAAAGFAPSRWSTDHRPPGDIHPPEAWKKLYVSGQPVGFEWPANIHFRVLGAANHDYALLFRDYLRQHKEAAAAYENAKRELARVLPYDSEIYAELKDPICDLIMVEARRWRAGILKIR